MCCGLLQLTRYCALHLSCHTSCDTQQQCRCSTAEYLGGFGCIHIHRGVGWAPSTVSIGYVSFASPVPGLGLVGAPPAALLLSLPSWWLCPQRSSQIPAGALQPGHNNTTVDRNSAGLRWWGIQQLGSASPMQATHPLSCPHSGLHVLLCDVL